MLQGNPTSPGIAIGKAKLFFNPPLSIEKTSIHSIENEFNRFQLAVNQTKKDLLNLKSKAMATIGPQQAEIFEAHLMLLEDPEVIQKTKALVQEKMVCIEFAYFEIISQYVNLFKQMDDEYMSARASDILDVSRRLLGHLMNVPVIDLNQISDQVIVVAEDLSPSETANLDAHQILGFLTVNGGSTSHSSIIARSLAIPAISGIGQLKNTIKDGDLIIMDGDSGEIIINPSGQQLKKYQERWENEKAMEEVYLKMKQLPAKTQDGYQIELAANISSSEDLDLVIKNGADGIGLFRTEFIYMDRSAAPDEKVQQEIYQHIVEQMNPLPVVIRTLDAGGDKHIPYLNIENELNPFLGYRAIRICLDQPELFKTQIRAILKTCDFGKVRILIPMISSLEELLETKKIFKQVEQEIHFQGTYEFGIMIEVPAAALMVDALACHVDFMSIGTNDLIQYTCAVDRLGPKLTHLYSPAHPAVLQLINKVIQSGHQYHFWTGICGEAAASLKMLPLFIGMGVEELSVNPRAILKIKYAMSKLNLSDCQALAQQALQMSSSKEVSILLDKFYHN